MTETAPELKAKLTLSIPGVPSEIQTLILLPGGRSKVIEMTMCSRDSISQVARMCTVLTMTTPRINGYQMYIFVFFVV